MSLALPAYFKAWLPLDILSILFCFSWPSGCFFFLSGWVGFPLPRFLLPRGFFWRFFLLRGGWVPLAAFFPVFSPRFLGGLGAFLVFCVFLLSLASCVFLSSRPKLGKHGLPTRKPPGPPALFLGASVLTRLLLGVDGQTRRGKGRGGDRGFVTPHNYLGTMMVIACLSFPRGAPHPPELTLAVSPALESILGVWLFFVCNLTT